MSKTEKLRERFFGSPKDFTWDELTTLLRGYGYYPKEAAGSRVCFYNEEIDDSIKLHKPHPGKIVKGYVISEIIKKLKELYH